MPSAISSVTSTTPRFGRALKASCAEVSRRAPVPGPRAPFSSSRPPIGRNEGVQHFRWSKPEVFLEPNVAS
eukprot:1501364-Lingulodinium_polyedra.AAC.1